MLKIKGAALYFALCVAVAMLAKSRGRSGWIWFVVAFLTTPLISAGLLMIMRRGALERNALR